MSRKDGKREWGKKPPYRDELFPRVRSLFLQIVEEMEVRHLMEESDELPIAMAIPRQDGLQYEIYVAFDGWDTVFLGVGDLIWCEFFSYPEHWKIAEECIRGVLSSEYRVVTYTKKGRSKPYMSELQKPVIDRWEAVYVCSCLSPRNLLPFGKYLLTRREHYIRSQSEPIAPHKS